MNYFLFSGNTSSNIGNAFFYEGVRYVIKKMDSNANIIDSPFPMKNAYHLNQAEFENELDFSEFLDNADYVILSGPILDKDFGYFFRKVLSYCKKNGIKVLMLSIGGRKYDTEEVAVCSKILADFPPFVLMSRDSDTFNNYNKFAQNSFDGICFAFYASDYFKSPKSNQKYICSTIDFYSEPQFNVDEKGDVDILFNQMNIGTKSKINKLRFAFNFVKSSEIGKYKIVRLNHRPLRNKRFIFHRKNMMVSHSFQPYLFFYENCEITFTDRLHAAVVTLAFGNKARLILSSNRTKLLERAGILECTKKVISADLEFISKEKSLMLNWLHGILQGAN